jgi:hypothetical protein
MICDSVAFKYHVYLNTAFHLMWKRYEQIYNKLEERSYDTGEKEIKKARRKDNKGEKIKKI